MEHVFYVIGGVLSILVITVVLMSLLVLVLAGMFRRLHKSDTWGMIKYYVKICNKLDIPARRELAKEWRDVLDKYL